MAASGRGRGGKESGYLCTSGMQHCWYCSAGPKHARYVRTGECCQSQRILLAAPGLSVVRCLTVLVGAGGLSLGRRSGEPHTACAATRCNAADTTLCFMRIRSGRQRTRVGTFSLCSGTGQAAAAQLGARRPPTTGEVFDDKLKSRSSGLKFLLFFLSMSLELRKPSKPCTG